uniref:Uncharacterized protein n=1 Tax=Strigops habroptila TaxID=2489341 RepID=A0A672V7G9_STRHB
MRGEPSRDHSFILTISQVGKGTLRRTWELSEVTDWTPAHHRMEYSQGSFTVPPTNISSLKGELLPSATAVITDVLGLNCVEWVYNRPQSLHKQPKGIASKWFELERFLHHLDALQPKPQTISDTFS